MPRLRLHERARRQPDAHGHRLGPTGAGISEGSARTDALLRLTQAQGSAAAPYAPASRVSYGGGEAILLAVALLVVASGTSVMARFGLDGLFYFMVVAALLLALLAAAQSLTTAPPEHHERPFEILAPQAASLAHDPFDSIRRAPVADPGRGYFQGRLIRSESRSPRRNAGRNEAARATARRCGRNRIAPRFRLAGFCLVRRLMRKS